MEIGYALSSEEHRPLDLVRHARLAEEAGFPFALVSDHSHPWIDTQGQSPFVWSLLGAIAVQTERLRVGTGVTCPLIRTHPAIQVRPDQEGFLDFYASEVIPGVRELETARAGAAS